MSLQQDIKEKILSQEDELREILLDLVLDIDDGKKTSTKTKETLLEDIRELVYQEEGK
ncbi:hypothetical protein [Tetragenococcus halophilus]|uniref:hypothetical protein n=1 Tax=Tetragenococcus halophilus TaxID=51669 RepID=UPI000CA675F4|nr:hypothetical protein [Tetragenococcus halophilus]MDN6161807.1 hypothetical protein [Atopostipes sp.]GBD61696.1 hypothetical protein TEH11_1379 [Tetragenococcus halophilus subsp. halophilus]GMG62155.1 hypothetical protein TEHAB4_19020 [Tetragenococcus halophilus]GMG69734.1 hypothetical protein TEHOK1_04230 [Tetragenococcus halophilus]